MTRVVVPLLALNLLAAPLAAEAQQAGTMGRFGLLNTFTAVCDSEKGRILKARRRRTPVGLSGLSHERRTGTCHRLCWWGWASRRFLGSGDRRLRQVANAIENGPRGLADGLQFGIESGTRVHPRHNHFEIRDDEGEGFVDLVGGPEGHVHFRPNPLSFAQHLLVRLVRVEEHA
jgi:hypothetical protein